MTVDIGNPILNLENLLTTRSARHTSSPLLRDDFEKQRTRIAVNYQRRTTV